MIFNYDNKIYDFYGYLLKIYQALFPSLVELEKTHLLLNSKDMKIEYKKYYDEKVKMFGVNDRDSIFVKHYYRLFDSDYTFLSMYLTFIIEQIKPLFPKEKYLIIQKTPNIRFHLHGYSNIGKLYSDPSKNIIGHHKDSQFGHNKSSLNVIVAITDMFQSNSIWYETNEKQSPANYKSMDLSKDQFFMGDLSNKYHYNKINETYSTRVSLDIRVIPFSKYDDSELTSPLTKTKFKIGGYYMII